MIKRVILAMFLAPAAYAQGADDPLSAIDWLSESVRQPASITRDTPPGARPPVAGEPPVADHVTVPDVRVMPLGQTPQVVGVLPTAETGLPITLWRGSDPAVLRDVIHATPHAPLPVMQDLVIRLLLAQAEPPHGDDDTVLLARVDHLLNIAALDQATKLIESAGADAPEMFRRYFDATLLTGQEYRACEVMENHPAVSPTWPARVFCLARGGDWSAAALTLGTARALGDITEDDDILLSRFLDPDLYEGEDLPHTSQITPLDFRLREAVGEPVTTRGLPLAFSVSELRSNSGWKAQAEAAEVLAAHGVLSPDRLSDIFHAGRPAASGGIWDRIAAVQAFSKSHDPNRLPAAWRAAQAGRTEVVFASLWVDQIKQIDNDTARRVVLLSPQYERAGQGDTLPERIARGQSGPANTPHERAVAQAFADDANPPANLTEMAEQNRLGEAILRSIALFETGRAGDPVAVRDALIFLRSVGLEDVARSSALQYLLLDRPT